MNDPKPPPEDDPRLYTEPVTKKSLLANWGSRRVDPENCPDGPHRGPQGPNEDLAQCFWCLMPSHAMRPWGETFGEHLPDCSLPIWHESYCQPGGTGHPAAPTIRG